MRSVKLLIAAGLIAGLPALAHAEWYAGLDAGANALSDSTASGSNTNLNTSSDWGYTVLGDVGYSFGKPKAEFELGYRDNGAHAVGGGSASGDTSSLSFMVNGVYDLLGTGKWHPFLGVGIGGANVSANSVHQTNAAGYTGSDLVFAYQGIAGIGYDLTNNVMAKVQYRYFATLDPSFSYNGTSVTVPNSNHSLLVGLTYKFGAPAAAPEPAPAPVAAAAPAPAPAAKAAPRNFMVFFDFNKSDISPQAAAIIHDAAGAAKMGGVTRVGVTGHTDLAGSDKYNMALSMKRANAVRDALVAQGVPASEIVVLGKGKSEPLVPTQDGVREPQNRRVEIVLE